MERPRPLRGLDLAAFTPHLDEPFRLCLDGGDALELVLVIAEPAGGHGLPEGSRESFSLVFRGPAEPRLPQRIYPLEHPELGRLEIFITPVGPDDAGMRYEAVFS